MFNCGGCIFSFLKLSSEVLCCETVLNGIGSGLSIDVEEQGEFLGVLGVGGSFEDIEVTD